MIRSRNIRRTTLLTVLLAAVFAMTSWAGEGKPSKPVDPETKPSSPAPEKDLVAVVNGDAISTNQVNREMSGYQQRLIRSGQAITQERLAGLRERVVESLIDRSLLYQESIKEGIDVSEEEVEEKWGMIRQRFTSEEAYQLALKRMQINEEEVRDEIRRGQAVQKLIDKLFGETSKISDEDARAFYDSHKDAFVRPEQVRVRHILLQPDSKGGEEAKTEAKETLQKIRKEAMAGKDFAELAQDHSKCPSAERGGDLGFFPRGKMAKPFEDAAFALKPGEISGVVKTQFGYHLIKQEERSPEGLIPFDDVKDTVSDYLGKEAVKEAVRSHVKQLRQEAVIRRFDSTEENG